MSSRRKILFLGGSLNQTKIAHAVSRHLEDEFECWFSPAYTDAPALGGLQRRGLLEWTALGGTFREMSLSYLADHGARVDDRAERNRYALVVATSDLVPQRNLEGVPRVLLQEGMTDPERLMYRLVTTLRLPKYLASTSTSGLSKSYDYFCVASEGYKTAFAAKGIAPHRMVVTGLPHWDNIAADVTGDGFPHSDYVLVATSDARETFKIERRRRFLREVIGIAAGRPIIFKLHPNERAVRASKEIREAAPDARVVVDGDINPMIANCDELVTQYSTVVYTGMALGKRCHSYFDMAALARLMPMQNGGTSASRMAAVVRHAAEPTRNRDPRALVDVCACRDCRSGASELHAAAG